MDAKQKLKGQLALLGYFPPEMDAVPLPIDVPTGAPTALSESTENPTASAPLEEGVRKVLVGGRLVKKKVKRHSAAERAKWRRAAKKPGAKMARKKLAKKPATKRKQRIRARLSESLQQVQTPAAASAPQTDNVVAPITRESALEGFTELSRTAELLAQSFAIFGEAYEAPELVVTASRYNALSEQSKSVVEGLLTVPESFDVQAVVPRFVAMHDLLQDGLQLNAILADHSASEASEQPLGN